MVGLNANTESLIKDLISLEYNAIAAYDAAIWRLQDIPSKQQLQQFVEDDQRHLSELTAYAKSNGLEPPTGPDAKVALTKGKVVIGGLIGDKSILFVMKTNEDDTVTAHTRASEFKESPDILLPVVQRAATDEIRHRTWIENQMKHLEKHAA